jgi:hypothetical protein
VAAPIGKGRNPEAYSRAVLTRVEGVLVDNSKLFAAQAVNRLFSGTTTDCNQLADDWVAGEFSAIEAVCTQEVADDLRIAGYGAEVDTLDPEVDDMIGYAVDAEYRSRSGFLIQCIKNHN